MNSVQDFYTNLYRIRRFEETVLENFQKGVFFGTTHTYARKPMQLVSSATYSLRILFSAITAVTGISWHMAGTCGRCLLS